MSPGQGERRPRTRDRALCDRETTPAIVNERENANDNIGKAIGNNRDCRSRKRSERYRSSPMESVNFYSLFSLFINSVGGGEEGVKF